MSQMPEAAGAGPAASAARDAAVSVVSAYGAFRVLLVLLAVWTFFAGFSLLTQGVGALSLGGDDTAERVAGAHMIMLAPLYGLLAWRRDQYRLFLWVPYAAQAAIIVAIAWSGFEDGALLLIVAIIFLALLVYLWWSSHPLDFFAPEEPDEDEDVAAPRPAPAPPGEPAETADRERNRRYIRR